MAGYGIRTISSAGYGILLSTSLFSNFLYNFHAGMRRAGVAITNVLCAGSRSEFFTQPQCIFYQNPTSPENFNATEILKSHLNTPAVPQQYSSTAVQQHPSRTIGYYLHLIQIFYPVDTGVNPTIYLVHVDDV